MDGHSSSFADTRIDLAGEEVTRYLALQLNKQGHMFHSSSELQVVGKVKEQRCALLSSSEQGKNKKAMIDQALASNLASGGDLYILPDGKVLEIQKEKYTSPEILFHPEEIGLECLCTVSLSF